MCVFTAIAVAGGAAGFGAGATAATTGLLAGSTLGSAVMADVGLAGSGFSAFSSMQQGDAQADLYNYQAQVAQRQNELATADRNARADRLISTQTAQFGALGVELAGGSTIPAISRTAHDAQLDIFNNNFASQTNQSALRASGRNAQFSGRTQAASSLLDFGTKAAGIFA